MIEVCGINGGIAYIFVRDGDVVIICRYGPLDVVYEIWEGGSCVKVWKDFYI